MPSNLPEAPVHLPTDNPAWLDWFVTIGNLVDTSSQIADVAVGYSAGAGGSLTSSYTEQTAISIYVDPSMPNTKIVGFASCIALNYSSGTYTVKVNLNDANDVIRGFTSFSGVGSIVFPFVYTPGAGTHDLALWAKTTAVSGGTIEVPTLIAFRFYAQ